MRRYRRFAVLAAALTLSAGLAPLLAPVSAHADTATTMTPADLVAALTAAEAPSASAGQGGWLAQGTDTPAGGPTSAMKAVYAVSRGTIDAGNGNAMVEAQHSGTYITLSSMGGPRTVSAVRAALAKPNAAWVFVPDGSLDLLASDPSNPLPHIAPDGVLRQLVDPTQTKVAGSPTSSVDASGNTTYSFSDTDLTAGSAQGTATVTIDANGVLTAASMTSTVEAATFAYTYGPQQVALPPAASTITQAQFIEGTFLATLPAQVKRAATMTAAQATRTAHHRAVKQGAIRTAATRTVAVPNQIVGARVFTTKAIPGGVRITGTNRYTGQRVAYTVTASGKRAIARKA